MRETLGYTKGPSQLWTQPLRDTLEDTLMESLGTLGRDTRGHTQWEILKENEDNAIEGT